MIPAITWGLSPSYEFCFDGVEEGTVVAVSTIGCKHAKLNFMRGYNEMLKQIKPSKIICFGTPFPDMQGKIIAVDYMASRKAVR